MTATRPTAGLDINDETWAAGERVLDALMNCSIDVTAGALAYAIRHHAIHAELMGGDDCAIAWLAQVRSAVDAAEDELGEYIEREMDGDARREAILTEVKALLAGEAEPLRRAA